MTYYVTEIFDCNCINTTLSESKRFLVVTITVSVKCERTHQRNVQRMSVNCDPM